MESGEEPKKEKKLGEPGYINKNCWLAKNLGYPPSKHCQYCESKFQNCLFFRYLIISLVLVLALLAASFYVDHNISRSLIISVFVLVITYGYYFDKSTQKIIEASFAQRKAKEELEDLNKNLKHKVDDQTKSIRTAYESEKVAKEKVNAARVEDEALLSSIGDGVIAVDKDGKIMFINIATEQMLEIEAKSAIGRPYEEVLRVENEKGEALTREKNRLYDALAYGKKTITDVSCKAESMLYYVKTDKTRFPVAVTIAPVILNGKITGAIDVFRDITIEKQIDKSKSEFVSLASHQLRTPLTAIKWYSEALLGKKSENLLPKQKKYLKEISHGNERMIKLIDVLLNVSRMEAGKVKAEPTEIDAKKMMCSIVQEQKFGIKEKKHKLSFVCNDVLPGISPKIFADPNLIRMVFQNIISNAVKYTPENGKITCSINEKNKNVVFEITDTGIGIPKDQQKRVFEKLFRASNAFPHDPEGNGLGLYLAKSTVENVGGKIWFESKEGEGTTFFVQLPLFEEQKTK